MKTPTCIGLLLLAGPVLLANPAVSEINGKIGAMHGSMDSESTTSLEGSITWPVLESFGFQLDGLYSTMQPYAYGFAQVDEEDLGGVGGHFFWRDSETAMLGVEAGYVFGDSVDSWELGLEAEYYYKWLTIGGKAGVASISSDRPMTSIETDKDAFFCQLYLAAYPVDNLLVAAFAENRFDNTYFSVEVEYELPVPGLSVFANAMTGEHGYDHAFVGMRYYFGEDKPLRSRHRENDPRNTLTGIRHGIGTWQADVHDQVVKAAKQAPVGSGGSMGGSGTIGGTLTVSNGGNVIGPGSGLSSGGSLSTSGSLVTHVGGAAALSLNNSGSLSGNSPGGALTPGGVTLVVTPSNPGLTLGGSGSTGGSPVVIGLTGTGTVHIGSGNITQGSGSTGGSLVMNSGGTTTLSLTNFLSVSNPISAVDWMTSQNPAILQTDRLTPSYATGLSIPTSATWGSSDGLIIFTPLGP